MRRWMAPERFALRLERRLLERFVLRLSGACWSALARAERRLERFRFLRSCGGACGALALALALGAALAEPLALTLERRLLERSFRLERRLLERFFLLLPPLMRLRERRLRERRLLERRLVLRERRLEERRLVLLLRRLERRGLLLRLRLALVFRLPPRSMDAIMAW